MDGGRRNGLTQPYAREVRGVRNGSHICNLTFPNGHIKESKNDER